MDPDTVAIPPRQAGARRRDGGTPNRFVRAFAMILSVALAPALASAAPDGRPVRAVGCVAMTVSDLDRSLAFYEKVLDFRKVLEEAVGAATAAGATVVSRGVARLPGSRLGLARALLVRDPDGHALLLSEAPPVLARPGAP